MFPCDYFRSISVMMIHDNITSLFRVITDIVRDKRHLFIKAGYYETAQVNEGSPDSMHAHKTTVYAIFISLNFHLSRQF